MRIKPYRFALLMILLIFATFGCGLFNQVSQGVGSIATDVNEGRNLVGTVRAITTDVGRSGLLKTAQALATTAGESGLLKTAVAFATQQGPELKETVQAFATQDLPSLGETAQAMATQVGPTLGAPPADIPQMEGQKTDFIGAQKFVSYSIVAKFTDVVDFYLKAMPENGWSKSSEKTISEGSLVELTYEKADQSASVSIGTVPLTDKVVVVIVLTP